VRYDVEFGFPVRIFRVQSNEPYLDLPDTDDLSHEQLDLQVQKAQEQLLSLKRQQDLIEKQKRELEELSRRQEQLNEGRETMIEKFTRALVILEREAFEARKRVEQLQEIHEAFGQHLEVLEGINPKAWDPSEMNRELSKALSAVDDARAEYARSLPRVMPEEGGVPMLHDEEGYAMAAPEHDFTYWLKSGFAFTLPLLCLGILYLLVTLFNQGNA